MKRPLTLLFLLASILLGPSRGTAGPTEDLWKALKGADYPAALAAVAAGADVNNLDPAFGTPLNFAACWADSAVVRALLDAKSDVLFAAKANKYTPLMNAAAWGNTPAVKMLLAAGSDLKAVNIVGQTVLALAVYGAKLEIVKLIAAAGADPKEPYKLGTLDMNLLKSLVGVHSPAEKLAYIKTVAGSLAALGVTFPPRLSGAAESDYTPLEDLAGYLIGQGLDPNEEVPGWGTLIFQATELGKTGLVKGLLKAKVDVETKGKILVELGFFPLTLLQAAALKGHNDIVEVLIASGASVNTVTTMVKSENKSDTKASWIEITTEKQTALTFASEGKHPDTAELIRKHGGLAPGDLEK